MTKDEAIHKVVQLAYDQVGYKEGSNNWNKYAADPRMTQFYGWNVQNQYWCNIFADWIPVDLFGVAAARDMLYGGSTACRIAAEQFQRNGAWFDYPEKGDQVFYYVSGGINHIGTVVDISGSTLTTVEGNYQDGVCIVTHYINDPSIVGYGRPNWSVVAGVDDEGDQADDDPAEKETGLVVDGECGPMTWAALTEELPILKEGSKGNLVRALQHVLNYYGAKLKVDGDFGPNTKAKTMEFQEGKL